ncbi:MULTISPECIES: hypothetical protein [Bacillaceae]|uniref:hypothetical protein n=1 Tax=Oceanobacillus sp. AG TaxID=2681969 RepID=UPI0012EBA3FA|nr:MULTISPECIES: hypothetical protein [Bacillaceae]HLR69643.1 hypothetical protein [Virgibacillus sp.]
MNIFYNGHFNRELKRGTVEQIDTNRKLYKKYFPDAGARVYEENRRNCGAPTILMASWEFILFAKKKILKDNWSPDVVVGHAKKIHSIPFLARKPYITGLITMI